VLKTQGAFMPDKPYYLAYETRYQKVYAAGGDCWGHGIDDEILAATLEKWVNENRLAGRKVIEFACGEGASGILLSRLGCLYHGVDISPSAVAKAKESLRDFPSARISRLDMVKETTGEIYDSALDCMGFHMLITDSDRAAYLHNAFNSLKDGSPMLFFRETYRREAYTGNVESLEQWKTITGDDYDTPQQRYAKNGDKEVEVWIPLVPARARNKEGYIAEMNRAGFVVDGFVEMDMNEQCPYSASIFVHKP
jgi:SAM-dependent methyltransferase